MTALEGIGLTILSQKNVIIRKLPGLQIQENLTKYFQFLGNMKISKVEKAWGDAITVQLTQNVWIDHCDLSATRDASVSKDFYDGLSDMSHATDFVTLSYNYYHDHVS